MPVEKRQLGNWLTEYLYFTRLAESPTQYHLWAGIAAISCALRRKCFINWGLRGYVYPNFYIALVGPPGGRKGTAMKIAKPMVQGLEIPMGSDALGSSQIMYKEMREADDHYCTAKGKEIHHKSLSIWSEEFQVFLSGKDPMIIPALTDLFDCADEWRYSTIKRGVEDLSNCWMTIIGAITPSLLQDILSHGAVGGGLVSRIIFVVGYGPIKRVAFPFLSKEELELRQQLMEDLQVIAQLSGPFKLDESFIRAYAPWYESQDGAAKINSDQFMGYNSRRAVHLNKLCMVMSASESNDMIIRDKHFYLALAILEETEAEMPNAFYGIGKSKRGDVYTSILYYLTGRDSVTFQELLSRFVLDVDSAQDLEQYINMLIATGNLRDESSSTVRGVYKVIQEGNVKRQSNLLNKTLYKKLGR